MSISYKDVGEQVRVISIDGRLDVDGTQSVAGQLAELAQAPKAGVVVDLMSLRFLASIGIRALVSAGKAVKERGGRMAIVATPRSSVMMSLQATGIDKVVPVCESIEDAQKAVQG